MNDKSKGQPVNKEAVKMLALELGAREAARRLGISEGTVTSWSCREKWDLPKRAPGFESNGRPSKAQSDLQSTPSQSLEGYHKELEARGKSAIARVAVDSAENVREPLRVNDARSLNDLANAMAKVFGWSQAASSINITGDKVLVVCDEGRRAELIEQRQRLLAGEKPAKAETV